ncbi:MAG: DNA-3-methyladenine glycosylase [Flavobacteriales bacterium]|nr:DNA-3-methyladenine glycosylase [Flavobacteriales bacterium]
MKLTRGFYTDQNALSASRSLLGKLLVLRSSMGRVSGINTETEAYCGMEDRASHAFGGKRTPRNSIMYGKGGTAYVYLCYGIHHLFNVVVHHVDVPHAVLVRAIQPMEGIQEMLERRPNARTSTGGPGTLTQALGIGSVHNGADLTADRIWIEDIGVKLKRNEVITGPRIGVEYAGVDALLPYRFRIATSRAIPT